jgi:glycosyltransferase involved in cell wall biosynthesis
VSTSYPPNVIGGAERSVQELARGLTQVGHQVRVLCLAPEDAQDLADVDEDVEVRRLPSRAFRPFSTQGKNATRLGKLTWHLQEFARIAGYRFLRSQFAEFRPDVIHTNNLAGFGWMAWQAAGSTPLVHTMRDYYLSCMASTYWHHDAPCSANHLPCRVSKAPFRLARRRPDLYVGISDDIVNRHRDYGSIRPSERALTIYNDPHLTVPSGLRRQTSASGTFMFGVLGRIGADKGTWKVIEAFSRMPTEVGGKELRLRIAGNGTQTNLARLDELIADDPRIDYVGVSTPETFYADLDCALVPTQWAEPFGRTAAEALISGIPLLASLTGGLPEVVAMYGGCGRLVADHTSTASWVQAMTDVAASGTIPRSDATRAPAASDVSSQYLAAYASVSGGDNR